MISVYESEPVANDDYLLYHKTANPDDAVLDYTSVDIAGNNDNTCPKTYVVKSRDEVGPNTFYLENHMYCKIGARVFVLALTQWEADKFNQAAYDVAIDMLKSLRATKEMR